MPARVRSVVDQILSFHAGTVAALASGSVSNDYFQELKKTAEMLQEDYASEEVEMVLSCPDLNEIKNNLPGLVAKLETELEKDEARKQLRLLASVGDQAFDNFILFDKYKNLIRKEWLLYRKLHSEEALSDMRFLFVSCGGMPLTAIGMAKTKGVRVDCYDIDKEAFLLADKMVSTLRMQDRIGVHHGSAHDIDYTPYDVVIVANLVQPQMEALARIASFKNVKAIIARRVRGLVSFMYASLNEKILPDLGLRLVDQADPLDKRSVHQSVLITTV